MWKEEGELGLELEKGGTAVFLVGWVLEKLSRLKVEAATIEPLAE